MGVGAILYRLLSRKTYRFLLTPLAIRRTVSAAPPERARGPARLRSTSVLRPAASPVARCSPLPGAPTRTPGPLTTSVSIAARWLAGSRSPCPASTPPTSPRRVTALEEAERLEELLSVFRESSAISQINRAAGSDAVEVAEEVFDLLTRCATSASPPVERSTSPSTPLSRAWGFLQREGRLHRMTKLRQPARSSDFGT